MDGDTQLKLTVFCGKLKTIWYFT